MVVVVTWNKYGMRSHAERGNEIKTIDTRFFDCGLN